MGRGKLGQVPVGKVVHRVEHRAARRRRRRQLRGAAQAIHALLGKALLHQHVAQSGQGVGIRRPQRHRMPMGGGRFVHPALLPQRVAEMVMGLGIRRAKLDGFAVRRLGLPGPVHPFQGDAEVVVGFRQVGRQPQRLAHVIQCLFGVAGPAQHAREVAMDVGPGAVQLQRPADQLQRLIVAAGLMEQHAEQVHGLGVVRTLGEQASIPAFRLDQPAGIVVGNGCFQALVRHSNLRERLCEGRWDHTGRGRAVQHPPHMK